MVSVIKRLTAMLLCVIMCISCSVYAAEFTDRIDAAVRPPQVKLKGNGKDTVTIMVYMNGSDLESENAQATKDLIEMIKAGGSEKVNIIVQTMGTKKWSKRLGIASDRSQIFKITETGLKLLKDDLGQLDCTREDTFEKFVRWTAKNYPADRFMLLFWDHGGGPVYGFGYDEFQTWNDSLTLDEIQSGLRKAGVYFDFIGMDCCIMSNLEVCCALYDFCDYVILSEDFESGLGWYYTDWLKALYKNTSIDTVSLAKIIIDDMVAKNEENEIEGDESILTIIDEGKMKVLMTAWMDFAYKNEKALTGKNYSQKHTRSGPVRVHPKYKASNFLSWWFDEEDTTLSDYYITDIMAVAQNINSDESDALASALNNAIMYSNCTSGNSGLTGLAISLPYGDPEFYSEMRTVFTNCGLDREYVSWLQRFVNASGNTNYYNYDSWEDEWSGWDDYEDDYDWGFWEILFGEDFWDDDDNWGWSDEDYYSSDYEDDSIFGFIDWLFSDEDDYHDYNDEDESTGFLNWLFSDEDDYYDYSDEDDSTGFLDWLFSDDDYEDDYSSDYDYDEDDDIFGFIGWLFS